MDNLVVQASRTFCQAEEKAGEAAAAAAEVDALGMGSLVH
jgi:hypothetical protein